jgi:hypothetical protein
MLLFISKFLVGCYNETWYRSTREHHATDSRSKNHGREYLKRTLSAY